MKCKFVQPDFVDPRLSLCMHDGAEADYVTGEKGVLAESMRRTGGCGPNGNWWYPRMDDPPPMPPSGA